MLLRFQVTNHASLRDEQELSLIASDRHPDERAERELASGDHRVVPVAAIYGTNASGKSNVIDAISWVRKAVLSSFRSWDPAGGVPRRPFSLRQDAASWPTSFSVDFALDGVRHEFGFSVDDDKVTEEWLYFYPEHRANRLYERKADASVVFGRSLTGRKKIISELLRPNSLYLSVAAAQGHPQLAAVYKWFQTGLRLATDGNFRSRLDHTVQLLRGDPEQNSPAPVLRLLHFADLGVSGLKVEDPDESVMDEYRRITQAMRETLGERVQVQANGLHSVQVEHRTAEGVFPLDLAEESSGTRTWIGLLGPVIATLTQGSVLCVDELDARLHPYLVDAVVGMFQSPEVNRTGAQLVFSTHEASLLGKNVRSELYRDQVWFTEKDPDTLATRLFPLTEFHVRDSGDNREKRYLTGRYGAVPYLDDDLLHEFSEAVGGA
ncbi:ATP-binding protein [Streptomyces xanthophaeus]|uniref:AAA family ATPase n=1 Tax=Streptomyces xanthophaeus TaxID=67385 RepID=UPI0038689246|nr:ATP-binding protein [Streptomyces xanthophaeus]WST61114.1 ATP-binding protein [Streptomyces xanthophaeus]